MPVDFLTKEQEQRYGRYASEPTAPQLARFFHLADNDLKLALKKHGEANQLGFALQLATVRFLGNFLLDPTEVPAGVISHLGQQLGITNPGMVLPHYLDRQTTHYEHAAKIKQLYGYRDFHNQPHHFQLVRWLYTRAWLSSERPSLLFDLTTAYLVERKILLPGISVLERVVASARDRAIGELGRLCKTLYILTYIDDEGYRRRILIQLNRGESRHTMARAIFHGKRGELRQRYREGQEDQLGALGLVVNMLVLWNTIYMDAALNQIRQEGKIEVKPEDVARLSPLGFEHRNLLGRYHFSVPEYIQQGQLRPLRNPADPND